MALMKLVVLAVVFAMALAGGHGGHGGNKCVAPSGDKITSLDASSQAQIASIWATYDAAVNANCSQQWTDTMAVFKAAFEAKAAALTGNAKTVYDQIQAIKADTTTDFQAKGQQIKTLLDAQDQATKDALSAVFPVHHGGGKWGGKSSEEVTTPVAVVG